MAQIQIGVNMEFVRHHDMNFEAGVAKAAELGYEYIEPMVHLGRELLSEAGYFHSISMWDDPRDARAICEKNNVRCSGLSAHTPLCKPDYDDERYLHRFELFIAGNEYSNAYSESNDPVFQRKTLYEQSLRRDVDKETSPMDENFVQAIETGMPPTGGLGLGIDRMVMLLTGERSIRDILLFPTMKPENQ